MTPEASGGTEAGQAVASTASEASLFEDVEAFTSFKSAEELGGDLDAYWAQWGLVRRWRDLPEPALVSPPPESDSGGFPLLDDDDLIAYTGPGDVRDSAFFCFGTEQDGGRLLAGRLFTQHSRLDPRHIVKTWGAADGTSPDSPAIEAVRAARAVEARNEAALGNMELVERFMAVDLRLWRGARWQEPVATALLGDWASTLHTHGTIRRGALEQLMRDAREIHRQLTPLWRRRCAGQRLLSLDVPVLDDGLTLGDLIASGLDPAEALTGVLPDDPRILSVLNQLSPLERAVALSWSQPCTTSWTEAAADVLALDTLAEAGLDRLAGLDAQALGERVRRKLKRLGSRHVAQHSPDSALAPQAYEDRPGNDLPEENSAPAG
ncbi:hypothetical protein Sros01_72670 [Streptomyces roseochromogenus]|nr:hypothetical protein Sros01_72670 [Streptomyces roseochromogenus]